MYDYWVLNEPVVSITHGVSVDKLREIIRLGEVLPSRFWGVTSLSINGYFNAFAYRDAVLIFDFDKIMERYTLHPVFYVKVEDEHRYKNYGLSPINLFWEFEVFTRQPISIYDVSKVVIIEENGAVAVPQRLVDMLETDYALPVEVGSREETCVGQNLLTVRHLLRLMKEYNYPSIRVTEPPEEVANFVDRLNRDLAKLFGLGKVYWGLCVRS